MSRGDYLWVGLNLLGAYLIAAGCVQVGVGLFDGNQNNWQAYSPYSSPSWGLWTYREAVHGGLSIVVGGCLLVASRVVGRPAGRAGQMAADYAEPPTRSVPPNAPRAPEA